MSKKSISTLIVDDSKLVQQVLDDIISEDEELRVSGIAGDPYEAVKLIQKEIPDVITLDIEMPRMDGITFLKKLMLQHPIPVIIVSAHTASNKQLVLQAFENGAMYVMHKPEVEDEENFKKYSTRLCELIKMAASHKQNYTGHITKGMPIGEAENLALLQAYQKLISHRPSVIAIGASAGGTMAIQTVLCDIHGKPPPIVITQHMPAGFTTDFADRLNKQTELIVVEAMGNETLSDGHVYIAPGDYHLLVGRRKNQLVTLLSNEDPVNHHKPSVEVLFKSVANTIGKNSMAFLLTGMGIDGAQGLLQIRKSGGITFAQDKGTSVVYGMPGEAKRIGASIRDIQVDLIGKLISTLSLK